MTSDSTSTLTRSKERGLDLDAFNVKVALAGGLWHADRMDLQHTHPPVEESGAVTLEALLALGDKVCPDCWKEGIFTLDDDFSAVEKILTVHDAVFDALDALEAELDSISDLDDLAQKLEEVRSALMSTGVRRDPPGFFLELPEVLENEYRPSARRRLEAAAARIKALGDPENRAVVLEYCLDRVAPSEVEIFERLRPDSTEPFPTLGCLGVLESQAQAKRALLAVDPQWVTCALSPQKLGDITVDSFALWVNSGPTMALRLFSLTDALVSMPVAVFLAQNFGEGDLLDMIVHDGPLESGIAEAVVALHDPRDGVGPSLREAVAMAHAL